MSERNQQIVGERIAGNTLESIGSKYGITRERVRQIIGQYAWNHRNELPSEEMFSALRIHKPAWWDKPKSPKKRTEIPPILQVVSPGMGCCFACHKTGVDLFPRCKFFFFCRDCFKRFFFTKAGRELQGMDTPREIVRIRDNHTCQGQDCGRVWVYGERRFDIHHLNGVCGLKSRSYDNITDIDNLITLCHKCHLNLPEVIEKMATKSGRWKERDALSPTAT